MSDQDAGERGTQAALSQQVAVTARGLAEAEGKVQELRAAVAARVAAERDAERVRRDAELQAVREAEAVRAGQYRQYMARYEEAVRVHGAECGALRERVRSAEGALGEAVQAVQAAVRAHGEAAKHSYITAGVTAGSTQSDAPHPSVVPASPSASTSVEAQQYAVPQPEVQKDVQRAVHQAVQELLGLADHVVRKVQETVKTVNEGIQARLQTNPYAPKINA